MKVKIYNKLKRNIKSLPDDVKRDLKKKVKRIRAETFFPEKYKSKKDCYKMRVGENETHRAFFEKVKVEGEIILKLMWIKPRKDAY